MKVYRIALKEFITDLSGTGARLYGGRWNSKGISMLYTSQSAALALLEFVCNSNNLITTKKIALAEIIFPTSTKFSQLSMNELPADWTKYPSPFFLKEIGDKWIKENKTIALKIPSAVLSMENNILVNPAHKDYDKLLLSLIDDFNFDQRLIIH